MHFFRTWFGLTCIAICVAIVSWAWAQANDDEEPETEASPAPLTAERLNDLLLIIDDSTERDGNSWQLMVSNRSVLVVCDPDSDRMRIMTPVANASMVNEALAIRMLQANFDAVLDARYAIANDLVWSVFIHPFTSTSDSELASAIGQVVVAADTFGSSFTSGALIYGGGDTQKEHENLLNELHELLSPSV